MDDQAYADPDLVTGYIARRGVATYHVADPDRPHLTPCDIEVAMLKPAGWARGLRRKGLTTDAACAALVDASPPSRRPLDVGVVDPDTWAIAEAAVADGDLEARDLAAAKAAMGRETIDLPVRIADNPAAPERTLRR